MILALQIILVYFRGGLLNGIHIDFNKDVDIDMVIDLNCQNVRVMT